MAALRIADADIIFSSCGFSIFLLCSFFPRLIPAVAIGCLLHFHTWCGHGANLECRSEMCCTRLAENKGRKKSPKFRHLGTIAQLCRSVSSQLRHVSTLGKNLLNSNNCTTSPYNTPNFGPITAEIGLPVWGTLEISTGFASWLHYCSDVAHRRPTKLRTMFGRLLGWYTIYTFSGALSGAVAP